MNLRYRKPICSDGETLKFNSNVVGPNVASSDNKAQDQQPNIEPKTRQITVLLVCSQLEQNRTSSSSASFFFSIDSTRLCPENKVTLHNIGKTYRNSFLFLLYLHSLRIWNLDVLSLIGLFRVGVGKLVERVDLYLLRYCFIW